MTSRWRFLRRRVEELDERVEEAQQNAAKATWEAQESERRKEIIHERVVEPLRRAGAHNQFAELIRQSLAAGHENHQGGAA